MPRRPASVVGAVPVRPLTAARPLPEETQSTLPPSAFTWAAKSAGTLPVNETTYRPVAATLPLAATAAASMGARATGSDGTRASGTHAALATTARVANRGIDLTSDTGCLTEKGTENMAPIVRVSKLKRQG